MRKTKMEGLASLGLTTVADVLFYAPVRYEDRNVRADADGKTIAIRGQVVQAGSLRWFAQRRSRLTARLELVEGGTAEVVWFNQPYWKDRLTKGRLIQVVGKWDEARRQISAQQTNLDPVPDEEPTLTPVYGLTRGITAGWMQDLVKEVLAEYLEEVEEILPEDLLVQYRLLPRQEALRCLHQPRTPREAHQARRRLAYEELLLYQLCILARCAHRRSRPGIAHAWSAEQLDPFYQALPWALTSSQQAALEEIFADMRTKQPMHRLLQGDVGTGKTILAAFALYANALSGYQGACMVPTEILVAQHYAAMVQWLVPLGIRILNLTSRMPAKAKRTALARLADGTAEVVVGTHALIQEHVSFARLGLIVTDEQHRFGVRQRAALHAKGEHPDMLCMTATPIPRTLTITAFGEQDVSSLRERPKGRAPITTEWVRSKAWPRVYQQLFDTCERTEQAYVVSPRIEAMNEEDLNHAERLYREMSEKLRPYRVGLLHGRLGQEEKAQVMQDFLAAKVQVLVATTVIEVGVDVPNATLMVIDAADHFGLAQLHQLRGRVGRGTRPSTCVLVADPANEQAVERMQILTTTQDGFAIAEKDLALRGPGEFLGVRQSGLPQFRIADLTRDQKIVEVARSDAEQLLPLLPIDPSLNAIATLVEEEIEKIRAH